MEVIRTLKTLATSDSQEAHLAEVTKKIRPVIKPDPNGSQKDPKDLNTLSTGDLIRVFQECQFAKESDAQELYEQYLFPTLRN